jgi:DNA-binding NarL/FixJ family response regulator
MTNDANPSRLRVLLAEEECVRDVLVRVLTRSPRLDIIADASPEQTSALLELQPPHVLLASTYPPQRALSLLAELASMQRARRPLAIAHVTRYSQAEWKRWDALGFDGYLLKEVGSRGLADRLFAVVADVRTDITR